MARPTQNTVDYFSHDCNHKQTIYILENRYKNDGYAFWFKLLESLGSAPNHFLDLNDETACEFLAAKTNLDWSLCDEILTLLAKINAICPNLWSKKIVWCQKFVDRMAGVYAKRKRELPSKPSFCDGNDSISVVSVTEIPQSKVNKTKVNKTRLDKTKKEESSADFEKSANEEPPFTEKCEIEDNRSEKLDPKQSKAEKSLKEQKPNAWAIWIDVNREFGREDPFTTGKDTRAAKSILAQIKDPEKYADILRQFLSDDDRFLMQNGHGISFLQGKINKYLNQSYQSKVPKNDEESEWWGNDEIEQQIEDQLWIDDPVGMQRQLDAAMEAAAIAKKMAEEKKEQAKKAQEALK
jgi:hypothetical protein